MADHQHPIHHRRYDPVGVTGRPYYTNTDSQHGPSGSQLLAIITLLPVGGTFLALSGLALAGSVIGLLICAPLFLIFSPVIVPAAFTIGLAIAGFLTAGAFGITGLSSLTYVVNYARNVAGFNQYGAGAGQYSALDQVKNRLADSAEYVGEKTKDLGQGIQNKAHEVKTEKQGNQGNQNQNRYREAVKT